MPSTDEIVDEFIEDDGFVTVHPFLPRVHPQATLTTEKANELLSQEVKASSRDREVHHSLNMERRMSISIEVADGQFLADVQAELDRARAKFPDNHHQFAALSEEHGEAAKALLERDYGEATDEEVYAELVQVAAMAVRVAVEGDDTFTYEPLTRA